MFQVKTLSDNAQIPQRSSLQAAGYDLFSAYDYIVKAHGKELILTDIAVKIPTGYYGRIAPRSSLSWKNHTDIGAGVIDCDYRGNVGVVIFNHSNQDLEIKKHDRVAQLILESITTPEVTVVDSLDDTDRGSGGFGSTGR